MTIAYDSGTVDSNHAQLTDGMELVPAGDVVALVDGDGADAIAGQFLTRLRAAAQTIGDHTDVIRATVRQNADALKQAAADLRAVDDQGASDYQAVDAIVAQTAADTTKDDVAASTQYAAGADEAPASAGPGATPGSGASPGPNGTTSGSADGSSGTPVPSSGRQ